MATYLSDYYAKAALREEQGIPPLPLNAEEVAQLCQLILNPPKEAGEDLVALLRERVLPGVDESSRLKAEFLYDLATGKQQTRLISPQEAVLLLGTMKGGYNVGFLVRLLGVPALAAAACDALSDTLLIYDAFEEVKTLCELGNSEAQRLMHNWAEASWFTGRPTLADRLTLTVFKVSGEINTDDFSPAQDAWSRPDIPLHARAMFKCSREGLTADVEGVQGPLRLISELKAKGHPLLFVGDVVGTGSSRKSAANSLLWHIGHDLPGVPNKRGGGFVAGGKIAPIFYTTLEDSGALPVECPVDRLSNGMVVDFYPWEGRITPQGSEECLASFTLKTPTLADEVRAGGRINLIIGKALCKRARDYLKLGPSPVFAAPLQVDRHCGYTRAQKIVGRACGLKGVYPGQYCEMQVTTVGSQDTTGPMTRDELVDLACLKFQSPLVMQSFCHTAAYPKPVDVKTHQTLPGFFISRGGVALRPGDGVIHSWLNRLCLPDTVGTGGDSHTRMPLGISFPAGSGLVAFASAVGMMPLDMPESVLVRFTGRRKAGITLRDLVHAIPYFALQQGLLTVAKQGKQNVFSGKILEIEGLEDLSVEHAFELADASAERSAAACSVRLSPASVSTYLRSNIALIKQLIEAGYESRQALSGRMAAMEQSLEQLDLIEADRDCQYAAVLEIDCDKIEEPIVCAPNDPDDARLLSSVAGERVDEVFIGSCMTNIGHFRAAEAILHSQRSEVPVRLWLTPPTRMDRQQLTEEGLLTTFGRVGARLEIPGCSLCMGNQARVRDHATVLSTSTRNFPNRLGNDANCYLGSAELAAVTALLGRLPTAEEYFRHTEVLKGQEERIYSLLNFAS